MADYQPLSVRTGQREEAGPYEGIPAHLLPHLVAWLREALTDRIGETEAGLTEFVVLRLAVPVPIYAVAWEQRDTLLRAVAQDESLMLDTLDLLLSVRAGHAEGLRLMLSVGGSVWTVSSDLQALEKRVSPQEAAAKQAAVAAGDTVALELSTAWSSTFGIKPDASDAWDHAIKALEALLIPLVVPNQQKATLGHVVGTIKSDATKWTVGLTSNGALSDGETLLALLQLVWANPDRHGNADSRVPTQDEAEKIVKIAVLIVGVCRAGQLQKLP